MARKRLSLSKYQAGIKGQDRVILSQAITLVESNRYSDRQLAGELLESLMPDTGHSYRIGVTGVPGVGKSSFIDAFGSLLTSLGKKVAVLAIDPSSQVSRGSILGDKTRMERLSHDPMAYIRPSPTGGSLGGVARKTRETLLLCEAAGFSYILVETVGVGQSETTVRGMVDFFLLLMLPNAGDELQGIKKGIMEMAHGLVINKADGDFLPASRQAKAQYSQALRLFPKGEAQWRAKVLTCSATEGRGLEAVWQTLEAFRTQTQQNGFWHKNRSQQALSWMEETIQYELSRAFYEDPSLASRLPQLRNEVAKGSHSPIHLAEKLVQDWVAARLSG